MRYDFDTVVDRKSLGAEKWKGLPEGTIAMSVADMDFSLMPEVVEEIKKAAEKGEFGYVALNDKDYKAVIDWVKKRRGVDINPSHLVGTPGVLYSARTAMYSLTKPGDKVVVQTPLHTPSIATASMLGRIPVINELIYKDGKYYIDFDHLESCFKNGAKVLMMCAPNNPTGRVWTREELETIGEIVSKYNGYVVSDEIHADIIWEGHKHISPVDIPSLADRSVAVFSTSKTFNMGGFHVGSAIIPNKEIRDGFVQRFYSHGHSCNRPSLLCAVAQTAAYTYGEEWFGQMMNYVKGNMDLAKQYLADTPIRPNNPEGTFLLWADIDELGWDCDKLWDVMKNDWRVIADPGHYYHTKDYATYKGPEHHIRLNLATSRITLEEALTRIVKYFK